MKKNKTMRKLLKALAGQNMHRLMCCYENALLDMGGNVEQLGDELKKYFA